MARLPAPRSFRLVVNPAAGGGRAARVLPAVEAELRRLGLPFTTERTTSVAHARELAVAAHAAGEVPVTLSGDGLVGCVAGALSGLGAAEPPLMGVLPGGRGNDFVRVTGIPAEPVAACAVLATGVPSPVDLGSVDGAPFIGIASLGFDSEANRIANAAPARLGNLVYAYGALRALASYRHATFTVEAEGEPRTFTGWSVAAANASTYGGGMVMAPDARLDDGALDVVLSAATSRARFLRTLPAVFKGEHVHEPSVSVLRAAEVRISADRPFTVYADGDPIGELPVTDRRPPRGRAGAPARMRGAGWKGAAARAAGAASRRAGKGGTSLPGKLLLRLEPHAIAKLSRGLGRSGVISATNGKTTTAAMVAAILEGGGARLVTNRAGANMAGGVTGALLTGQGDTGLFEVDEFWLGPIVEELGAGGDVVLLLANLFRDQLDRYGELESIADRWAAIVAAGHARGLVLNADDPLVADLGRDRAGVTYFGVEDTSLATAGLQHASDSTHCRRCGAPYTYDAVFLGHLGHYHCPNCDAARPQPTITAHDVTLDGVRGARFELRTPAGSARIALPLPGLYNVYNALGAAGLALELGAPLAGVVAGLEGVAAAFGRAETVAVAGHDVSIMLVKNPAGANEVLRTLALEAGEHDLLAILNDQTADGRDVSWIWDADFEALAPRLRRAVCSGTRAPEMALRLKYAGVDEAAITVEPALPRALDEALAGAPEGGRVFALPTYTAMLGLREELVRRGVAGSSFG